MLVRVMVLMPLLLVVGGGGAWVGSGRNLQVSTLP